LHGLDVAPIALLKSRKRLRDMERAEASQFLTQLAQKPVGANLVFAARMAVLSQYFDQDEVTEAIGYTPVPFMVERIALRKRLLADETPEPEDMIGPYSETAAEAGDLR